MSAAAAYNSRYVNAKRMKQTENALILIQKFDQVITMQYQILRSVQRLNLEQKQLRASDLFHKEWLTSADVMIILDLSKRQLQNLRDHKVIPCTNIGKKFYYKIQDIQECLERNYKVRPDIPELEGNRYLNY
jgi:hypothetical protein